jgi:hypothetical protein
VLVATVLPETITPYLLLMLAGFVVGTVGHVYKSKLVVGIGIFMIFAATLLLPLALIATEESPDTPPNVNPPGANTDR